MKYFTFIIKSGANKNRVIDSCFAASRKDAEARLEQTLIDCGVLVKAAGYIFVKNYRVQTQEV